jgi:hypothetical protein
MPYIKQEDRDKIDSKLNPLLLTPLSSGELNYVITKLCNFYLSYHKPNYSTMNNIIGVLECAKLEYYRRICGPYEDTKVKENGDVY